MHEARASAGCLRTRLTARSGFSLAYVVASALATTMSVAAAVQDPATVPTTAPVQDAAPPAAPVLKTAPPAAPPANNEIQSTTGQAAASETFTIKFQDTDVQQALQMLSMQSRKNLVAGKGVSGTVTANLYDVTVREALDVIMRALDLHAEEEGQFIFVYTSEDWASRQLLLLRRESRNFALQNLSAKDAADFVKPLLSEGGLLSFVGTVSDGFQPSNADGGSDSWAYEGMLVVNDFPEQVAAVAKLLAEIDTPPMQVVVESTIVSTRVKENNAYGVDVSVIGDLDFVDFSNPISAANDLFKGNSGGTPTNNGNAVTSNVAAFSEPATMRVGVVQDDVAVFLRLLDQVTDTTILARPRVMALNRQRAQVLVGDRVGYLSTTTTQTSTTQTVEFLDTGIKLIFRPFISKDGSIRMELAPSISSATLEKVLQPGGGVLPIPNEKTNEIVTNVRVKDGQTLVLGGLFTEETEISRRQVPGLGDIPLLGDAFKGQDDSVERREIIFLITPNIVKDEIAKVWSDEANVFVDAVRIGAREGLLPWSRELISTNHNQDAVQAMANGDRELAMFHVESSLRVTPNQPEMQRMRSELDTSRDGNAYERSIFQRIVEKQLQEAEASRDAKAGLPVPTPDAAPATAPAATQSSAGSTANTPLALCTSASPVSTARWSSSWWVRTPAVVPAPKIVSNTAIASVNAMQPE